jgi:hypothetical protein
LSDKDKKAQELLDSQWSLSMLFNQLLFTSNNQRGNEDRFGGFELTNDLNNFFANGMNYGMNTMNPAPQPKPPGVPTFSKNLSTTGNIDAGGLLNAGSDLSEAGLTKATINSIPSMIFKNDQQKSAELDKTECCICLLPFDQGVDLRL